MKYPIVQSVFEALCDTTLNPFSKFLTMVVDNKMQLSNPSSRNSIKIQTQKSVNGLIEKIYDRWDTEILNNRKLEFFNCVKDSHDPDFYIYNIDDTHAQKYLASLRLNCHQLRIEVGRYTNLNRDERICQHCNLNAIEARA